MVLTPARWSVTSLLAFVYIFTRPITGGDGLGGDERMVVCMKLGLAGRHHGF